MSRGAGQLTAGPPIIAGICVAPTDRAGEVALCSCKGRDLAVTLAGLGQWGDKYLSEKPPRITRRGSDKRPVVAAFVPKGAEAVSESELESVPGPGSRLPDSGSIPAAAVTR